MRGTFREGAGGGGAGTERPELVDDHAVLLVFDIVALGDAVVCVEVKDGNLSLYPTRPGMVLDDVATE
jgi:hypothetical protein